MAINLNPQRQKQRKSEDLETQYQKQKRIFQSPSESKLMKQSLPLHPQKHNLKNMSKNTHIPSIFRKTKPIPNRQLRSGTDLDISNSTPDNLNQVPRKIFQFSHETPMTVSCGLPKINSSSIKFVQKEIQQTKNEKKEHLGIGIEKQFWLSKRPIGSSKTPRKFFEKRKTLFTPRDASPPLFLKKAGKKTKQKDKQIKQGFNLSNFKIGRYLGSGRFGEYYQAIHIESGFLICLKRLQKAKIIQNGLVSKVVQSIIQNMSLQHYAIRKLYGVFEDDTSLYLILEYTQIKTLNNYLKNNHLTETQSVHRIKEIGSAVKYIHDRHLIHRGINSESILVTYGICKICDFQLMTQVIDKKSPSALVNNEEKTISFKGRPQIKTIAFSYDMWCLGLLVYEIMTGKSLENTIGSHSSPILFKIHPGKINFPLNMSLDAKNLILALLQPTPKNRITIDKMLDSPLINNTKEQVQWEKYVKNDFKDSKGAKSIKESARQKRIDAVSSKFFTIKRALSRS